MLSLGVFGSGSGSNFQAILDAIDQEKLDAKVACVLSDQKDAFILQRARQRDIPAIWLDCAPYKTKLDGDAQHNAIDLLQKHGADTVVLAGFMRMIKQGLLDAFPERVLNIHPSLLPAFPGLASWKQAVEYGVKVSGCTVHFVDLGMDTGPIILQRTVPVYHHDTPDSLHERIQEQEHIAYPTALQWLSDGSLTIEDHRVVVAHDKPA